MATKTITTKAGHTVQYKDDLTGRDYRDLRAVYLSGMTVQPGASQPVGALGGDVIQRAEDKAIELLVVDVDGSKNDVLNTLLAFPAEDYQQVIEALNEVTASITGKVTG